MKQNEKLQEMDREYEVALRTVSEKEKSLSQKSTNIHLLQKQVRELRAASTRKEGTLQRAALIFNEYRSAFQNAQFKTEQKVTVPVGLTNGISVVSGIKEVQTASSHRKLLKHFLKIKTC